MRYDSHALIQKSINVIFGSVALFMSASVGQKSVTTEIDGYVSKMKTG